MIDVSLPLAQVAQLLDFLSGFEESDRAFCDDPEFRSEDRHAVSRVQSPIYDDDVVDFFMLIGTKPWVDPGYHSYQPERFVSDPALIERADFLEVRALLNLCSRGERFCDGYWLNVLKDGIVQAALRRLHVLSVEDRGRVSST